MQNVSAVNRRPVPFRAAAVGSLLAFVAGAVIAVGAPLVVNGWFATNSARTEAATSAVGAQLIAHDRSEQGLGGASVGGELIAHDRSESGSTGK